MRKFAIVTLAVLFFGCANENQFTIDGSVEGASDDQWVYLERKDVNSTSVLDSARLGEEGTFQFEWETEYPGFYNLSMGDRFATLLIRPGEEVRFQAQEDRFHDYTVEGSPGSKDVKMLDQRLRKTRSRLDSLTRQYNQTAGNVNPEQMEEINEKYRAIVNQQRDSSVSFIISHLNSLASIMALYQKINDDLFVLYKNSDLQYIKLVADSLQARYPQSKHVKALVANKEDLMTKYKNLELQQTLNQFGEVNNYPEVSLPNLQGDTVSLQDLDAKMVLVSFWASYSKQSIQRNMELMSIYKRYHDQGFEIYQVSLDQSREQWRKAVEFDQLPWINVSNLQGLGSYPARVYNVQEIPTDYLIHQERGILAKNPNKQTLKRQLSIALD